VLAVEARRSSPPGRSWPPRCAAHRPARSFRGTTPVRAHPTSRFVHHRSAHPKTSRRCIS